MIHRLNLYSNLSRDVEAAQRALKADVNISTTLDVQNVPRDMMNACSECVQRAVVFVFGVAPSATYYGDTD